MSVSLDRYRGNDAVLSACGRYRYTLERDWTPDQQQLPTVTASVDVTLKVPPASDVAVLFVMLNPSTADARFDDPTIRRCIAFARAWGYNRLLVGNLFALRATDPTSLLLDEDPVGPDNDEWLGKLAARAHAVIVAWGAHRAVGRRGDTVLESLRTHGNLYTLGLTKDGKPRHPLYLPGALWPQPLN